MPRRRASEEIAERRAAMAESDRRNRKLFLLGIAAFVLLIGVALIVRAVRSGPIDLNRASAAQLDTLPGVGPETAKAIIKGRPYRSIDDLQKVKGIGPATVGKIRDKVKVAE